MTVIIALLAFSFLILVHEFGHFIMAKINGVYVYEFSLGMGPKLISWKGKETAYAVRLFPIGGYVKMMGEDEESDNPLSFGKKTILQRMSIVFAGPFMNFLIAAVLFIVVFMCIGTYSQQPILGEIMPEMPAYTSGLQAGDKIVEINDVAIGTWQEMVTIVQQNPDKELVLDVDRQGNMLTVAVTPSLNTENGMGVLGVTASKEKTGFFAAIGLGLKQTYEFTKAMVVVLWQMITGQVAADLAGPVGVVSMVGEVAKVGFANLLMLIGFLSINLGFMNLLPLPALDGGRLVFMMIEAVRGKPVDPQKEGMVHFIGLMILFGLMIIITYKDVVRLITG